jgi:hypothetical protein
MLLSREPVPLFLLFKLSRIQGRDHFEISASFYSDGHSADPAGWHKQLQSTTEHCGGGALGGDPYRRGRDPSQEEERGGEEPDCGDGSGEG